MKAEKALIDPEEGDGIEIKQGVVNLENKRTTRLRVAGLRGAFGSIHFGDDHVSTTEVPEDVKEKLITTFPHAEIEEVEVPD